MKRYLEVEVDNDMIKESGLDADDYIRQEMAWMEESGFILCDVISELASVEDRARSVAEEFTPIDAPSSRFIAECAHNADPIDYCQKARDEKQGQPPTFYFSFGSSDSYPFRGGWVEVRADDIKQAETLFRSHFPDRHPGVLNCAFVYTEQEWRKTLMAEGHGGQKCHQVIDTPGVYRRDLPKGKPIPSLVEKAKERMAKRVERAASKHQRSEQER